MADYDDDREAIWNGLFYLILFAIGLFLFLTWPVGLYFGVSLGGWRLARKKKNPWMKAADGTLFALSLGLGALCVSLVVFNALKKTIEPAWIQAFEKTMVGVRIDVKRMTSINLPAFIGILFVLVVVNRYLPRLKLVTRYLFANKVLSTTLVALTAMTSFTVFAQVPMERWAGTAHEAAIDRYQAALRDEEAAVAGLLAAQTVAKTLDSLTDDDKQYYRDLFETISEETRGPGDSLARALTIKVPMKDGQVVPLNLTLDRRASVESQGLAERVGEAIADRHVTDKIVDYELTRERVGAGTIGTTGDSIHIYDRATTSTEWKERLESIERQEDEARSKWQAQNETVKALTAAFCRVVGLGVPEIAGIAGKYIRKVVDGYAEKVFQAVIQRARRRGADTMGHEVNITAEMVETFATSADKKAIESVVSVRPDMEVPDAARSRQEMLQAMRSEIAFRVKMEVEAKKSEMVERAKFEERAKTESRARSRGRAAPRGR